MKDISACLLSIIKGELGPDKFSRLKDKDFYLDVPSDARFGDFSTNIALKLSRIFKISPLEVINIDNINQRIRSSDIKDYVEKARIEGAGFINFYLTPKYFYEQLLCLLKKGKTAFAEDKGKARRVLIEFVSANPTGPLSVAHARQAAVGDSLANILAFLGYRVKKEYYLNDEGNQIDILGKSVGLRIRELAGEKIEFPADHYQGDYIYDIARKAKGAKAKSLSDYAAKYILDIIKKELHDLGINFDYWFSQKYLRKSGKINEALALLKKKGFLYEQDGALWFKSTQFADDKDRVVIKSDRSYTYLAPDIAYHQQKYRRRFNWLINLWGPDHHGYINRLKAAVMAIGRDPDSLSIVIVQLATVFRQGKPVQMSTRRGEYITLREVLDEAGKDAARFFFLMRRTSSHLDFDLDIAKKQTAENPVFYVQYAYARICSILRNAQTEARLSSNPDPSLLKEDEELALIKKLLQFSYILNACLSTLDPYMLTVYLGELAESFHKFYDAHRVLCENKALAQARLSLIRAAKIVIAEGLGLVGVSKPEKM